MLSSRGDQSQSSYGVHILNIDERTCLTSLDSYESAQSEVPQLPLARNAYRRAVSAHSKHRPAGEDSRLKQCHRICRAAMYLGNR